MNCFGCSKIITSKKNCPLCNYFFCSDSCIEAHKITYHRIDKTLINNKNFEQQLKVSPKRVIISSFITKGQILNKSNYNPLFKIENFSYLYDKDNKPIIIGSGSYGQVFLCINKINKKKYAIKHMDKERLKKALKTLNGIYLEIDLQSKILHQNIVQLLYVEETKKSFNLVMECAFFGSLFDFIRKNKYLDEDISFKYFIQVANAVYFLHQNDLIHRDIKPENILLFDNDIVKLCDFGWCIRLNGGQRGTFCGTTEYMAPEMVNQKEYSKEIDVWSLGVLLYEMLHGYSPFIPKKPTFNEREVMENIKIHNLEFDKNVSMDCKDLICHLLDENREKRYKIEDIFNSEFVKKYEKKLINKIEIGNINMHNSNIIVNNNLNFKKYDVISNRKNENIIKIKSDQNKYKKIIKDEDDINNHSKCISNIDNLNNRLNHLNNNINININNIKDKERIKRGKTANGHLINKTANNFYPKNYIKNNIPIYQKINKINIENNNNMGTPRKKIEFNNENISPELNNSNKCDLIPKYKISAKIIPLKEKERKNHFHIFDKAIECYNQKESNQKNNLNIIHVDFKKESKIKNNLFENQNIYNKIDKNQKEEKNLENVVQITTVKDDNEKDKENSIINNYSFEAESNNLNNNNQNNNINNNNNQNINNNNNQNNNINNNNQNSNINNNNENNNNGNYMISDGNNNNNNIPTMIKKLPVNAGNSIINHNRNIIQNNFHIVKKNCVKNSNKINLKCLMSKNSGNNIKKKSLISYKSNGEYIIEPKSNSPIIIRNNNNNNRSNNSNIKQKKKIFIKNNSSNLFNINNNNNKSQINFVNKGNLYINENVSKTKNYTDLNYMSYKNTPDPEIYIPDNNKNNNYNDDKNMNLQDTSESIIFKNFNYVVINNNNNIISPMNNNDIQNKKKITKKDINNNIIVYPYTKLSKTPVKNNGHKKALIKNESETIEFEETIKQSNHQKSKAKSKSCIKHIQKKEINIDPKIKSGIGIIENNNINNNIILTNPNNIISSITSEPKVLNEDTKQSQSDFPIILKGEKKINSAETKDNNIELLNKTSKLNYFKQNNKYINSNDKKYNITTNLNKTIKIKSNKKEYYEDKIRSRQNNNSFSGGKAIKKISNIEHNYRNNSPLKIMGYNNKIVEQRKDTSENSKIIDEREFDVENNDDEIDEQQKTPRKTADKVKIFPCKLLSELSKKNN